MAEMLIQKNLRLDDCHLGRSIGYKLVQVLRRWEKMGKVTRLKKVGTAIVWCRVLLFIIGNFTVQKRNKCTLIVIELASHQKVDCKFISIVLCNNAMRFAYSIKNAL